MEKNPKSINPNSRMEQAAALERRKLRLRRLNVAALLRQRRLRQREKEVAWRQNIAGLMLAAGLTLRASLFAFGGYGSFMRKIQHDRFKFILSRYSREILDRS